MQIGPFSFDDFTARDRFLFVAHAPSLARPTPQNNATGSRRPQALLFFAVALLSSAVGCQTEELPVRPAPLAGLQHLEIVKVGQQVVFDARLSVVAALQGDEGASPEPGARLTGYRFTIADGSPIVEQTAPTLSRSFTEPGIYAVSLTIVDDRGEQSTVQSSVHVQPDFAPSCAPDALQACVSGRCAGGACVAMACAGQEVCALAGGDLSCRQGRCEKGAVAP